MTSGILSPTHLIFIIGVALLVLGPKRLPEVARAVGKGIRDFKQSIDGGDQPLFGALRDQSGDAHQATAPAADPVAAPASHSVAAASPTVAAPPSHPVAAAAAGEASSARPPS